MFAPTGEGVEDVEPLRVRLPVDPRGWEPGSARFAVKARLPANLAGGDYQLGLWLPDAATELAANPRYAIRFANDAVWEAAHGYNILGTVRVDTNAGGKASWWRREFKLEP